MCFISVLSTEDIGTSGTSMINDDTNLSVSYFTCIILGTLLLLTQIVLNSSHVHRMCTSWFQRLLWMQFVHL